MSFTNLNSEHGLSQNTVLTVAQDDAGFIWMGTRYGLNRYDGYRFKVYTNDPADSTSISNNYINTICYHPATGLWIGTEKGLNRFNPQKNRFERIPLGDNVATSAPVIDWIISDKDRIWVGSFNGLYVLTDPGKNRFTRADRLGILSKQENKRVRRLFKDSRGFLWIAGDSQSGPLRINLTSGRYEKKSFPIRDKGAGTISDNFVTAFYEDAAGALWLGTLNGLNRFDPATEQFTHFFADARNPDAIVHNNIRALESDAAGNIWIGTQDGISIMDPFTNRCTSYRYDADDPGSLSQNSIQCLFRDAKGSMWAGTFYGGVNVAYNPSLNAPVWQQRYSFPAISSNIISSIAMDDAHNLWIGTEGGGLNFVNQQTHQIRSYKNAPDAAGSLASNLIKTIYIDRDKNLWIGTHGGKLNRFDPQNGTFQTYLNEVGVLNYRQAEIPALLEDKQGLFWVGTSRGLNVFNRTGTLLQPASLQFVLKPLLNEYITALLEDRQQNIWIGTLKGIWRFNRRTSSITALSFTNATEPLKINCIAQDERGIIWLGLYYGGLATYNEDQHRFSVHGITQHLPNNNVTGILADKENNLWLSTGNGLVKFNPKKNAIRTYTISDGLPGNEFNKGAFLKARSDMLFFGGMKGLIGFRPDQIPENTDAAPLVFTGLKVLNETIAVEDPSGILPDDINHITQLVLPYRNNTFAVEFALLNFIKPGKNLYAYKLQEVHKDWIYSPIPAATFTNLSPGTYTLAIKGANNDGIWSTPRFLKIKVLPAFWATWWAYLIYAAAGFTLLFFVVRFFYLRALLRKDHALHEMKLNFFTNISHEIRTHLTLIQAPIEQIEQEHRKHPGLMRQLTHLKSNAHRLLQLVTELMDFRKAEATEIPLHIRRNDLIIFLNAIYESFEDLSLKKNIQLQLIHDLPEIFLYFDETQMEKVIFNLLNNAFKFTPEGGRIGMYVEDGKDRVMIHITDNGKGIAPEYLDKIFTNYFQAEDNPDKNTGYGIGLALSKSIVALHKGALHATSRPATNDTEGLTSFTVSLLKGHAHFKNTKIIPGQRQHDESAGSSNPAAADMPGLSPDSASFHILVVEDNESLRRLIRESLRNHYQITLCENGVEGWEAAIQQIPDLIISDVMMPEMDGLALCNMLKTDERTSHIPVVLLTAKSAQTDQITGLSRGADIYLTKPFSVPILQLTVHNLLSAREKMRQKFSKEFVIAPVNTVIRSADKDFIDRLVQIIEEHLDDPDFGVDPLSVKIAMSQSVLYKKLRALTDMSVNDFIKSIRLKKAAQLLQLKSYSINEISLMVGFYDRKYFSKEFKKQFGVTPREYIKNQEAAP
ncbi:hybrid sensor histidine kinase/response regulator transcription factor [Niabella beijingensis]|uniref:hybrid sensor histidine kinase/response regulator transcription factor n=1 Tax=Niabella beijingensis TaxID=2872700 RepID=UPI001CC18C0E|nr:hybrid sensor histidine kinase/response regulator transcription factor [Niabella beijingensis]MBZ4188311.1 response regulator [Niabella beijingensis]